MNIMSIKQVADTELRTNEPMEIERTTHSMAGSCLLALAEGWRMTFEDFRDDGYFDMPEGLDQMVDLAVYARENGYDSCACAMRAIEIAREEYGPGWEDVEDAMNHHDLASFLHAAESRAA